MENRQHERNGLARPRVRAANDVVAGKRDRDHSALNRRGLFESAHRDPFEKRRLEAERIKRYRRGVVIGLRAVRRLRPVRRLERRAAAVSGSVAGP